jgi:hypothetical protein
MKDFHEKLCEKITQDGGNYRVVLFGDHAWSACASWFPKEKVINHVRIAHGSLIRNNWHREQARDDFLITVDRASALSGAKPISFLDSEKSYFLHIGNDPKKVRSATRKEMQLQRDPEERMREEEERARKSAREEEERARKSTREEEERVRKKEGQVKGEGTGEEGDARDGNVKARGGSDRGGAGAVHDNHRGEEAQERVGSTA